MASEVLILIFLLVLPCAHSLSFNFTSFSLDGRLNFEGDATIASSVIQVTTNQRDKAMTDSMGRAFYPDPVRLWDAKTPNLTDFTTHFSFNISAFDPSGYGDGLAFFLAPVGSTLPVYSDGGYLGLVNDPAKSNSSESNIVAVEFDTYMNTWDPSADHVGINVNSVESVATVSWNSSMKDGRKANAWVIYNASSFNLSVFLTYANNPEFEGNSSLSLIIDLRTALPESVIVGFSAATGTATEIHNILSWDFNSSLEVTTEASNNGTVPSGSNNGTVPSGSNNGTASSGSNNGTVPSRSRNNTGLIVGIVVSVVGCSFVLLGALLFLWGKKKNEKMEEEDDELDVSMDHEFQKETGPRRFAYSDLSRATNNFSEDGKLGEGGFGGVYKGVLSDLGTDVAVKRVSKGSKQGKKEYISEVKIISRLRHRNLVQLIGWCHGRGELLLVYELMPNASLDYHLFGNEHVLSWEIRHKIALGIASALRYLHEEGEQCVIHRDIKSSNIMLDSNFNAKLGDFGLARFVDHKLGSQTTVLAGTMGYMAPECYMTGKASKESDVYSFGIVDLEIVTGRKPVEPRAEPSQVWLVEWVWTVYGQGKLVKAADNRLNAAYDERQLEHLMIVGLWCCHPDSTMRPTIRQVISVLNSEAPLPSLPSKLPVPTYSAPPVDIAQLLSTYTSSYMNYGSDEYMNTTATTDTTTTSSISSSQALLTLQATKLIHS